MHWFYVLKVIIKSSSFQIRELVSEQTWRSLCVVKGNWITAWAFFFFIVSIIFFFTQARYGCVQEQLDFDQIKLKKL